MEAVVFQVFAELLHSAQAPCLEESLEFGAVVAPLVSLLFVLEETIWPFSGQLQAWSRRLDLDLARPK